MGSGIVSVGKRQYASGLYWEDVPSGRVSQTAKEAARQPGHQARFYAVRAGDKDQRVPQFGLSQGHGHRIGLPVLAACLANQQPGSWVGAFRLREGVAVVVVRDDLIVPDGDQFFEDETEARDRLLQEMALGGLQRVYAPEPWGVPGADTMPVSLLLNDNIGVRLRPVALSQGAILAAVGGGGLLLLLLGAGWYWQDWLERKAADDLDKQSALDQARRVTSGIVPGFEKPPTYPEPERTWEKNPRPEKVWQACLDGMAKVPWTVAGWRMASGSCDGRTIILNWTRSGGMADMPSGFQITDDGMQATMSMPLSPLAERGAEKLDDPDALTARFVVQNWPGSLAHLPDDPPPPPPPGYQGQWNPPPTKWVKRSFNLTVPVLPWILPHLLGDVPGAVIKSMSFGSMDQNTVWTVEGVVYENRH